jgi:hypothetical protein
VALPVILFFYQRLRHRRRRGLAEQAAELARRVRYLERQQQQLEAYATASLPDMMGGDVHAFE